MTISSDYDDLPYETVPTAYTQPASLAALATAFGLEYPAPDRANVLEIGCGSGGNIIPLAARFAKANFQAFDLSQRHVDDANDRIAELGLANIRVRRADVAEESFDRQFDYIICHGVFSWVPKSAQDAILRICGENLAPRGIAAISYNVLPGWFLPQIVRDICLRYAGTEGSAPLRVAKARSALAQIAKGTSEKTPYGTFIREEAQRFAKFSDSYILGEFLAEHNTAGYFSEFAARAGKFGLSYLCEGHLASYVPQLPDQAEPAGAPSDAGDLALQQEIDLCSGRTFRRSVLIRSADAAGLQRRLNLERLGRLNFAIELGEEPRQADGAAVFRDKAGRLLRPSDAAVGAALSRFAAAYPATLTVAEATTPGAGEARSDVESRVCRALLNLVGADQATMSTLPLRVGRADADRPRGWKLARLDVEAGNSWATSQLHIGVELPPLAAFLLRRLDGKHDRAALKGLVMEALRRGDLNDPAGPAGQAGLVMEALRRGDLNDPAGPAGQAQPVNSELDLPATRYLEGALEFLARHGLLEP